MEWHIFACHSHCPGLCCPHGVVEDLAGHIWSWPPHPHTPVPQPVACFIIICPFVYEAVYGRVRVWDVMSVLCHDDIWPRISIQLISSVSFVAIPPTSCSGCYASRVECPVACGRKLLKTLLIRIIYYGKCYDSEAASVNCHENSVTYSIVPFLANMGIWHSGCGVVPGEYLYVKWIWNGAFYAECTCLINKSVWREMTASLKKSLN